jgi:hypothetical protein
MNENRVLDYPTPPQDARRDRGKLWTLLILLLIPGTCIVSVIAWYVWNIFFRRF